MSIMHELLHDDETLIEIETGIENEEETEEKDTDPQEESVKNFLCSNNKVGFRRTTGIDTEPFVVGLYGLKKLSDLQN
eukprot:CAMPEP_0196996964 /NCGR_PEP_ID=MMETSP1380-20130617/2729_1 /TAXON_ID=5936 /ORGANISM="Euplotes crassus, Strain CT5" /LENGTH=77 /DNA_ID=CAMNT_0042413089 /DNA_START=267 /DNA_END=500 /DNA_ORIENTATION=+